MNTALAETARRGGRQFLAAALHDSRVRTLALLDAYAAALGDALPVTYSPQINPPLWEAGHVGWFQDYWIARNRQRAQAIACNPDHQRPAGRLPQADARFDSGRVAHATRWQLDLPDLGLIPIRDAETGEQLMVDTHDAGFRQRFARIAAQREAQLRESLGRAGVDTLELSTDDDLAEAVLRFIDLRKRRLRETRNGIGGRPVPTQLPTRDRRSLGRGAPREGARPS